jgi:hypothetical protein
MTKPSKGDLLEHYCQKEPVPFIQFDDITDSNPLDSFIEPDEDGDFLSVTDTWELMSGTPAVRVLIRPGLSKKMVSKALQKIAKWILKSDILEERKKMLNYEATENSNKDIPF